VLLWHLHGDVDAGVVDQGELKIIFKGAFDWTQFARRLDAPPALPLPEDNELAPAAPKGPVRAMKRAKR
jgi:hypothetical protein